MKILCTTNPTHSTQNPTLAPCEVDGNSLQPQPAPLPAHGRTVTVTQTSKQKAVDKNSDHIHKWYLCSFICFATRLFSCLQQLTDMVSYCERRIEKWNMVTCIASRVSFERGAILGAAGAEGTTTACNQK
jgi:hypothetical protein